MRSITMCCTLSLMVYISFRKQGCTRGTNNCEVLIVEEWRQPINKDTKQSAVDTLADDIPGFPACRPDPWHWTILYRVKLSLEKTKSRIMCLSPKITSQALRSSLRGKQQPLFTLELGWGWGDKDREQICCCWIFTSFQMLGAQQKVCEEKHSTQKSKYLALQLLTP